MAGDEQTTAKHRFGSAARAVERWAGSPIAFGAAVAVVLVWAITGPLFNYSDTWQLVINTGTTIITFLMIFLVQNSQHRETAAIHLKLDELLRSHGEARNQLITAEEWSEEKLESERDNLQKRV